MAEQGTEGNCGDGCDGCGNCHDNAPNSPEDIAKELNEPIEVNLDQDVFDKLLEIYVRENLMPESYMVYEDCLASGSNVNDAVASSIVNELANIALKDELERHKNDETKS